MGIHVELIAQSVTAAVFDGLSSRKKAGGIIDVREVVEFGTRACDSYVIALWARSELVIDNEVKAATNQRRKIGVLWKFPFPHRSESNRKGNEPAEKAITKHVVTADRAARAGADCGVMTKDVKDRGQSTLRAGAEKVVFGDGEL